MIKINWNEVATITIGILIAEAVILLHKKIHENGIEL